MKFLKWAAAALCLMSLTACGQQEVLPPVEEPVSVQAVQEVSLPPLPEPAFTLMIEGSRFTGGCVYFGGKAFVEKAAAMEIPGLTGRTDLSVQVEGREYVPLKELCEASGMTLHGDDDKHIYMLCAPRQWQIPEGFDVPVLMYHGVSNDLWGMTELFVSPENMEAQIAWMVDNGYTPIWFEDLPHVDEIEKPVILTFDDGYMDNYTDLFPILKKYGVKATVFVVTGIVDYNPRTLTSAQIKEMSDSGLVSIQSHTATHPYLRGMSREQQSWELVQSKLDLAAITGKEPSVICYPSGSYDETTLELSREHYCMGIDMNGLMYTTGEDPYQVQRYYIRRQDTLGTIISYIQ
ncbi:MAG: polysaccharide deacetylase family protein [Oscillospiraceae bacterium]|nr:polysaccharide deacetylase family protein [Oscillospiraceae bacterium]